MVLMASLGSTHATVRWPGFAFPCQAMCEAPAESPPGLLTLELEISKFCWSPGTPVVQEALHETFIEQLIQDEESGASPGHEESSDRCIQAKATASPPLDAMNR